MWTVILITLLVGGVIGGVAYFVRIGRKLEGGEDAEETVAKLEQIREVAQEVDEATKEQLAEEAWQRKQGSRDNGSISDAFRLSDDE